MNHSSILQIHLNGGENSLSGGEHSIRIFSLASASSSSSPFPLLSEPTSDQKAKSRLKQQVRRLKGRRNLQVNWKATSDNTKKKEERKNRSEKFQGICFLGSVQKVRVRKMLGSSYRTLPNSRPDYSESLSSSLKNHDCTSL